MYSLLGYIEKKKRIKNCHYGKKRSNNDKKQYCKKIRFILNSKKIPNRWFTTIEILPISIVIQT